MLPGVPPSLRRVGYVVLWQLRDLGADFSGTMAGFVSAERNVTHPISRSFSRAVYMTYAAAGVRHQQVLCGRPGAGSKPRL